MTRVLYAANQPPSWIAGLSGSLAFFLLALLIAGVFLHRISLVPTPLAISIVGFVAAGAVVTLVLAAIAGLDIWVTGRQGAARVIVAATVALGLLSIPLAVWHVAKETPPINDITTDFTNPPPLETGPAGRSQRANPLTYPGDAFAEQQRAFYPDIQPIIISRSVEHTYDVVMQTLAKLRYRDLVSTPPSDESPDVGTVTFTETTPILGFTDDVTIRVEATNNGARIDLRSASRYGRNDFGANAKRLRTLLAAIVARLEATVPSLDADDDDPVAGDRRGKPTLKSRTERNRAREGRRR